MIMRIDNKYKNIIVFLECLIIFPVGVYLGKRFIESSNLLMSDSVPIILALSVLFFSFIAAIRNNTQQEWLWLEKKASFEMTLDDPTNPTMLFARNRGILPAYNVRIWADHKTLNDQFDDNKDELKGGEIWVYPLPKLWATNGVITFGVEYKHHKGFFKIKGADSGMRY